MFIFIHFEVELFHPSEQTGEIQLFTLLHLFNVVLLFNITFNNKINMSRAEQMLTESDARAPYFSVLMTKFKAGSIYGK